MTVSVPGKRARVSKFQLLAGYTRTPIVETSVRLIKSIYGLAYIYYLCPINMDWDDDRYVR
jgi:hypothetical protein